MQLIYAREKSDYIEKLYTGRHYLSCGVTAGVRMLEKRIEGKLKAALQARGALVYKFVSPGQAGVPDRLIVLPGGRCVFVELKQLKGRMNELQKWQIERLRTQGAEVYVVKGPEDAEALPGRLFPAPGGDGR